MNTAGKGSSTVRPEAGNPPGRQGILGVCGTRRAVPRALTLVVALCLCVAVLSLGDEVMEFDPAQYADVAARILVRGDWLHLDAGQVVTTQLSAEAIDK